MLNGNKATFTIVANYAPNESESGEDDVILLSIMGKKNWWIGDYDVIRIREYYRNRCGCCCWRTRCVCVPRVPGDPCDPDSAILERVVD
jgi:hypothetical protein